MKYSAVLFLIFSFFLTAEAQKKKPAKKGVSAAQSAKKIADEKTEFEKAVSLTNAGERALALKKFVADFPKSAEKTRALELIASARAEAADEKLRAGDAAAAISLFKLAVADAPAPVSDKLFTEIILQIPTSLFFRSERAGALEIARAIEEKVAGNRKQLLGLATFYLGTENAAEAKRLAEKVIQLEPDSAAAYQTLGLANRLNFRLEEAANAYQKALEIDSDSSVSRRSLAEMKRATGKPEEAAALYREVLAKDERDAAAQTGLILSLFGADKRAEAESEMQKALAANPDNLFLLVGAAYAYAARGEGARAVELAEKAVALEPRYTWAHIALARGLLRQNRPLEAERALLVARQYGNFPTLDYEIASARFEAGFFREAAEELRKTFALADGTLETRLGGRVPVEAKNFIDLLSLERRASIFEPNAADTPDAAQKLKALLDFSQKLDSAQTDEKTISEAADEFASGDDRMKLHRQLFAASQLLERKKALPKVLELAKSAVAFVDSSLEVAAPSAAVLADELYESRKIALSKGELVIVPNLSRQTLSAILRGRIEDISGWTLFQENKSSEAVVRLKRAVSVLPEKSAWWRATMWHLGAALEMDGKSKEALEAYIKSYTSQQPDAAKRIVIEALYQKINGSTEGLESKIGAKPLEAAQTNQTAQTIHTVEESKTAAQTTERENQINENQINENAAPSETKKTDAPETLPKAEPSPAQIAEAKTGDEKAIAEKKFDETNSAEAAEKNVEIKPTIEAKQTVTNKQTSNEKPLFEPIVIIVPKPETKSAESVKTDDGSEKPSGEILAAGEARARVVSEKNDAQTICKITASQETISILNDGGSLALTVDFEGGKAEELAAISSSPKDVEAVLQNEIGGVSNRAFFVVKSVSQNKGDYSIVFQMPCGKKEIAVKVR